VADSEVVVDVYADVGCPFAHVGLRQLVRRRADAGRNDVGIRVWAWPLELVNGRPLDAAFIASEVADISAQLPVDDFAGFRREAFPSTFLPAMALAAGAYRADLATGEMISLRLRTALFEEGRDVADPEVLRDIAGSTGLDLSVADGAVLDHAAVLAEYRAGQERGVVGSPHFFAPSGAFFCPSLDISHDADGHLRVSLDPAGFDAFVSSWLD
jgi:predicted DsbA family dithiol-disulfide isomerase